jgi:hypothetical protein
VCDCLCHRIHIHVWYFGFCFIVQIPTHSHTLTLSHTYTQTHTGYGETPATGWSGLWKGFGPRVVMIGTLTALQWFIYDSVKVAFGIPTTGAVEKKE